MSFPSSCTAATPLAYEQGVVNPPGSHVHNHLNFLRQPRDAQNRPPTHPDYDGRTLRVQQEDWKKHNNGKAMSEGTKQWWDLKAQYFDTVLLFKTGKFYEMYNMDADIGVQVCGTCLDAGFGFYLAYATGQNGNSLIVHRLSFRLEVYEGSCSACRLSRSGVW